MLEARDITARLGGRDVLRNVSFRLRPGEIAGVVGPNGAGKSTLLRSLAGLLSPSAGSVLLDGSPVGERDRRALGRSLAYLSQDRVVHWPLAVRAVVALGRLPHRTPFAGESPADAAAIAAAMATLDVSEFADRPVTELSGGERARVLIARALAQDARVLIADEPTAGLDPAHGLALVDHLTRVAGEGRGVVIATHDLSMAARVCGTITMLREGKVVAVGTGTEAFTADAMAATFGVRAIIDSVDGIPVVVPSFALTR